MASTEAYIAPPAFPRAMPAEVTSRPIRAGTRLERILAAGSFAVTAEIAPPASADGSEIRRHAAVYRGTVDACNVTDGQRALARISSMAAATSAVTVRGGDKVEQAPKVFIGAAADPFRGSKEESFGKLRGKVTAGADFVQTQGVYDVDAFEEWMRLVRKEWLHENVYILAGVIPLKSAKMAQFMVEKLGAVVPKHILDRMERAPNPKAEGVSIAVRTIKALKKIEGVRGVHLMPIGWEEVVPDVVKQAGLLPRPDPKP